MPARRQAFDHSTAPKFVATDVVGGIEVGKEEYPHFG
jgi:hypothetical protein